MKNYSQRRLKVYLILKKCIPSQLLAGSITNNIYYLFPFGYVVRYSVSLFHLPKSTRNDSRRDNKIQYTLVYAM